LNIKINPERVCLKANPFRVEYIFVVSIPRVLADSNPGLKLANAFGVFMLGNSLSLFFAVAIEMS
jgi:hypothetical protein